VCGRQPPSKYKSTIVRVSEVALPTLEKCIAVAQSDFAADAAALDIIDWIRAELFAGRGAAFQSEETGGPKTDRSHNWAVRGVRGAVRPKLNRNVDGPVEMRQRRQRRRLKRRAEYEATGDGARRKDAASREEADGVQRELAQRQDAVLLQAIEKLQAESREQARGGPYVIVHWHFSPYQYNDSPYERGDTGCANTR
jgi:hypothetical protein